MPFSKETPSIKVMDGQIFDDETTSITSDIIDATKYKKYTLSVDVSFEGEENNSQITIIPQYQPEEGAGWFDHEGTVLGDYEERIIKANGNPKHLYVTYHEDCCGSDMRFLVNAENTSETWTATLTLWVQPWS